MRSQMRFRPLFRPAPALTTLVLTALMLAACTYGPVVDRSRFESAALLPDQRTLVFSYRIQRLRPPTGISTFPDGGAPIYLEDRAVVATVPASGGRPRLLMRAPNPGVPDVARVTLDPYERDPEHVFVRIVEQASTSVSTPPMVRYLRLSTRDGSVLPYPDLKAELRARGRSLGADAFGDLQVLDPEGDLLVGAASADGDELWIRRAGGDYRLIDPVTHYYGLREDELYYWSGHEAVVRNWRTLERRVIARYDPALRQTVTLIRDDPTVRALQTPVRQPRLVATVADSGSSISIETRGPAGARAARPIPIEIEPLRREAQ